MRMNNKGFSFVEMMTVCVILCVLVVASYPVIIRTLKQSKTSLYKENVKELERAGIAWATEHASNLPDDQKDARFMTIKQLHKLGYLPREQIIDPRNDDEYMSGCIVIQKDKQQQYQAKFTEQVCNEAGKQYRPKIQVVEAGSSTYEVNSNTPYEMPVVTATSIRGEELAVSYPVIKKDGALTTYVEGTEVGSTYTLLYSVKDPVNGLEATKTLTVKIVDRKAPEITVLGEMAGFTEEIALGTKYEIPEAKVNDNSHGKVTLAVSTNLNTHLLGDYEIVYTATDASDNLGIFVLNVKVRNDTLLPENQIIIDNAKVLPGAGKLVKHGNSTYVFTGADPNNYLKIANTVYRIMRIDHNGIKVIRDQPVTNMSFSEQNGVRFDETGVNQYLNGPYLETLASDQIYLNKRIWNVGSLDLSRLKSIDQLQREETRYQTTKSYYISLPTISDYIMASSSEICSVNGEHCQDNYLLKKTSYWTSIPVFEQKLIYQIQGDGVVTAMTPSTKADVYPVMYLKGYKTLMGTGTKSDPYIIQG